MRTWHKCLPPKLAQREFNLYHGTWNPLLDRCWESEDGFSVMSRKIKTDWGTVEHVTIHRMYGDTTDITWADKQAIKDELFGDRLTAIEVFPDRKSLIDAKDIYHLWILPKNFKLPFGIHPTRDPQGEPVERGYDFNVDETTAWVESETRKRIMQMALSGTAPVDSHSN